MAKDRKSHDFNTIYDNDLDELPPQTAKKPKDNVLSLEAFLNTYHSKPPKSE